MLQASFLTFSGCSRGEALRMETGRHFRHLGRRREWCKVFKTDSDEPSCEESMALWALNCVMSFFFRCRGRPGQIKAAVKWKRVCETTPATQVPADDEQPAALPPGPPPPPPLEDAPTPKTQLWSFLTLCFLSCPPPSGSCQNWSES